MGIHDGHRKRLKDVFINSGASGLSDVNILELLLFYSVPRINTNPIAHALLDRFNTLDRVFDASFDELCTVEGVGPSTAVLIKLVPAMKARSEMIRSGRISTISNTGEAKAFFQPRLAFETEEVFAIVCLDSLKRVICFRELSRGVVNSVNVDIRKLAEIALGCRSSTVIVAHNHPDSNASPSSEDISCTQQIKNAFDMLGIPLIDHIIVSRESILSFADLNIL